MQIETSFNLVHVQADKGFAMIIALTNHADRAHNYAERAGNHIGLKGFAE